MIDIATVEINDGETACTTSRNGYFMTEFATRISILTEIKAITIWPVATPTIPQRVPYQRISTANGILMSANLLRISGRPMALYNTPGTYPSPVIHNAIEMRAVG